MIAGIVLAAGRSSRFGGIKPLAEFGGRPLILWPIAAMTEAGLDTVIVVTGANAEPIQEALASVAGCRVENCARWRDGQARSLQAGLLVAESLKADAALVALADQPLIHADAIKRVVGHRAVDALAVRATYEGVAGHPVLLERPLWPSLHTLEGDQGASAVLSTVRVIDVPCDGLGSAADVDTPEDLERLRAQHAER